MPNLFLSYQWHRYSFDTILDIFPCLVRADFSFYKNIDLSGIRTRFHASQYPPNLNDDSKENLSPRPQGEKQTLLPLLGSHLLVNDANNIKIYLYIIFFNKGRSKIEHICI